MLKALEDDLTTKLAFFPVLDEDTKSQNSRDGRDSMGHLIQPLPMEESTSKHLPKMVFHPV